MERPGKAVRTAVVVVLIAAGCLRIAATYTVYNQTYDEEMHIACGMEWLSKGTYTYEMQHPPLARVMVALGPYLHGIRSHSLPDVWDEGLALLEDGNQYWRVLTLARMGTLVFYLLGCLAVYLWSRRWFGPATALVAVFLFSTLPPVLGHSGLATNDMACCATVAMAAYCLLAWAEDPSRRRAACLSLAIAGAMLAKLSALFYVPACALAMAIAWWAARRPDAAALRKAAAWYLPRLAAILAVSLVLIWGGYRFSVQPLSALDKFAKVEQQIPLLRKVSAVPLPLTELMVGIAQLVHHNQEGHDSYVLGSYSKFGRWYFFPVVLGAKTPLGLLLLAIFGTVLAIRRIGRPEAAPLVATALCAVLILAVAMSTRINLGVRHLLPIYPFLAIVAAQSVVYLCSGGRPRWMMGVAAALLALDLAHTAAAGIDQLPYFNPLVGDRPERVLCESDLDWGQDLHRLAVRLRQLGVPRISVAYFGTAHLEKAGLPEFTSIDGKEPVTGYVAVSARNLALTAAKDGSFGWLKQVAPRERIGRSIYLFYLPETR